jgi:hypothetical protein
MLRQAPQRIFDEPFGKGFEADALRIDLEVRMDAGLHRIGGEQPLAEGVDRRNHESVAFLGQRASARSDLGLVVGQECRFRIPTGRVGASCELDQGGADLARHLGRGSLGEGDGDDPFDDPSRDRTRFQAVIRVPIPTRPDAPHHDARHQQGGLSGPGSGDDHHRPLELALSEAAGGLVGGHAFVAVLHSAPSPRSTPSHHSSRATS